MDECADIISQNDDHNKKLQNSQHTVGYLASTNVYSNDLMNCPKNPFDREFAYATKNQINLFTNRYVRNISTNPTSPLNTPSIHLNDSAYIPPALIDPSPAIPIHQSIICENEYFRPDFENGTVNNKNDNSHRSNVVSVICPPVPTSKVVDANNDNQAIKSAPIILDSNEDLANLKTLKQVESAVVPSSVSAPVSVSLTSNTVLTSLSKEKPSSPPTLLVSLSDQGSKSLFSENKSTEMVNFHSIKLTPFQDTTISNLIKILPKQNDPPSQTNASLKLPSLNPMKRKEKTVDELLSKIVATEAALPPKAKPGRKSRTGCHEDVKDRKKRSLERNRAAAMRCRLKKKKEIDELKSKVDKYEQQNNDLKRIIENLYKEVYELKNELMRHKDC